MHFCNKTLIKFFYIEHTPDIVIGISTILFYIHLNIQKNHPLNINVFPLLIIQKPIKRLKYNYILVYNLLNSILLIFISFYYFLCNRIIPYLHQTRVYIFHLIIVLFFFFCSFLFSAFILHELLFCSG